MYSSYTEAGRLSCIAISLLAVFLLAASNGECHVEEVASV